MTASSSPPLPPPPQLSLSTEKTVTVRGVHRKTDSSMGLAEKYVNICKTVRISFKNCGYDLRPRAGAGLWLVPLVPTALLLATVKQILRGGEKLSHAYFATTIVSCGLLMTTILYILRFMPRGHRIENYYLGLPAIATLVVLLFTQNGFILSLFGGLLSSYGVLSGLPTLLTLAPSCFSIGEAVIVVHGLVILLYSSAVNFSHLAFSHISLLGGMEMTYDVATVIVQVGMLCVFATLLALYVSPILRIPPLFYMVWGGAAVTTVVVLHGLLGGSPLLWIMMMVTRDHVTLHLFLWWALFCLVGVLFVIWQVNRNQKATTSQRKIFHILAVFVFASGIVWAPDILYLGSAVCFAIFLVVEAVRLYSVPPLSFILSHGFILYGDEKDTLFSLTPLYLLAGLAAPLWLTPLNTIPIPPSQLLPYLSGVLTIGIGDTAASYVGSKYGRRKWKGSNRTIEGTIACFLSQAVFVLLGAVFGLLTGDVLSFMKAFGAIAITSLIEAKTSQVDNVVLPLIFYIMTY
ncbi:hypothetical protein ONE63_002384 [Megalurothrips usitatus]|uniref:dolichol kinase n=1 Tax=Megalurothrips usitatus TaxID=439358 RepID=A0AAV7XC28_9NEOP|nr:hypothetical protein ONE63_002384 [Megalurothrips usitatus]